VINRIRLNFIALAPSEDLPVTLFGCPNKGLGLNYGAQRTKFLQSASPSFYSKDKFCRKLLLSACNRGHSACT
jgi:hypothetical protein